MRGCCFRGDVGHAAHVTILVPQRTSRRAAGASDLDAVMVRHLLTKPRTRRRLLALRDAALP
jgi:hypothetical protein